MTHKIKKAQYNLTVFTGRRISDLGEHGHFERVGANEKRVRIADPVERPREGRRNQ